jgi:transcription antitermination factor NusG
MPQFWYAVRSKPRKEDVVWRQIVSQGFEAYYPRIRVTPVNPRSRKVKPYFPSYLFVNADLDLAGLSTFQWIPHSIGLVSFGGEPAVVPDQLIQAIQKRVGEVNSAGGELFDGLQAGEAIWIKEGPFRGYEAIFDARLPGSERVRVLIEFLGNKRKVALTLETGQIERIRKSAK